MKTIDISSQTVGNIGLYFVCYKLSLNGWNVMPTSRNAKGIDIVIYNQNAKRKLTIQVKSLSKKSPVPFGSHLNNLFADFIVICREVSSRSPECFICKPSEVKKLIHKGIKDKRISYWFQLKDYDNSRFREKWQRIGKGN